MPRRIVLIRAPSNLGSDLNVGYEIALAEALSENPNQGARGQLRDRPRVRR
jgi:hypothetical protein